MFGRFHVLPHYGNLKLQMDGPKGMIIVNGCTPLSLERATALVTEVQAAEEAPKDGAASSRPENMVHHMGTADSSARPVCTPK